MLGVVENYTGDIFGEGAGPQLAEDMDIPFLGSIGLRADYRDSSRPTVLVSTDVWAEYETIWNRISARFAELESTAEEPESADAGQEKASPLS